MSSVTKHYQNLLAPHYTWMAGGLEGNVARNYDYFKSLSLLTENSGIALVLGAGSGF